MGPSPFMAGSLVELDRMVSSHLFSTSHLQPADDSRITLIPTLQHGAMRLFLTILQIAGLDNDLVSRDWLAWAVTSFGTLLMLLPTIASPRVLRIYFKLAVTAVFSLLFIYCLWIPAKASTHFQTPTDVITHFYDKTISGSSQPGNDRSYTWVIATLYSAHVFRGYDASVLFSEETLQASPVAAKGMCAGTLTAWLLSIPTLFLLLISNVDFTAVVSNEPAYFSVWAVYLLQILDYRVTMIFMVFLWLNTICTATSCMLAAQRLTFAMARDGLLPLSRCWRRLSGQGAGSEDIVARRAAMLVGSLSFIISTMRIVLQSSDLQSGESASSRIRLLASFPPSLVATSSIALNTSYIFPLIGRHFISKKTFIPGRWNLGRLSPYLASVSLPYLIFQSTVLLLPQSWPVTGSTFNYALIFTIVIWMATWTGWMFPRYGGRNWWSAGPKRTLDTDDMVKLKLAQKAMGPVSGSEVCQCRNHEVGGAEETEGQNERQTQHQQARREEPGNADIEADEAGRVQLQFAGRIE